MYNWNKPSPSISIGTLVLIIGERYPSSKWSLGRIIQTHSGADPVISIKTGSSVLQRPITKVCPLPINTPYEECSSSGSTKAGGNVWKIKAMEEPTSAPTLSLSRFLSPADVSSGVLRTPAAWPSKNKNYFLKRADSRHFSIRGVSQVISWKERILGISRYLECHKLELRARPLNPNLSGLWRTLSTKTNCRY